MTGTTTFLDRLIGRETVRTLNHRRLAILLGALVWLVLANPIADIASQTRFVIIGGAVTFLLACLQNVDAHPRLRLIARSMVLLWLVLNLPLGWLASGWAIGAASATLASLILIVLWLVAQRLAKAEQVDAELLCGALAVYLLLGVFWAETYDIISLIAPSAFAGPLGYGPGKSALFYFSFTTLTTTGYGDITPVNPVVRMWSVFEAIIGTMYNATVIARLVSLYGARVRQED
jgi:hypothetical protein